MKISYNWLKQYIDTNIGPEELSKILVNLGLEVEGLEQWQSVKGGLEGFVVGHVLECGKHPNADKLSVTKVNIGQAEPLCIVCGAPNVAAGQKVIVATIGTKIYSGEEVFEIKKSKIRGELSEGMICAEDEMGIGTSHDGILVLDPSIQVGTLASDYFKVENDWVFEIGLTPNRIDSASHYGVARDLAAFLNQSASVKLGKASVDAFKKDNNDLQIPVIVENAEACKRYSGVSIKGVTIKESPEWLKNRLKAIGVRPISNVVDITNYVLHEVGQPLHAFDADKIIGGKVIVRTLPNETTFTTLDGVERKLTSEDLMICNEKEGMCMAGIFGGLDSGVSENTKNIFLESAYFNPVWVRKTARRNALSTDSSFRFERGTDPNNTVYALKRAAMLIKEIAGGTISSDIVDVYPEPIADFKVEVSFKGMNSLIGKELDKAVVKNILQSLEIKVEKETSEGLSLSVPPYRVDVHHEADIVEEIIRIYGYNNIEFTEKVVSTLSYSKKPEPSEIQNLISDFLSSNGFNEIMCNSLTKGGYYETRESYKNSIAYIINPLSSDLNCMRQTLLFGGLESVGYNINRKSQNLKLYEFGNCYFFNKQENPANTLDQYSENFRLSMLLTGIVEQVNWNTPSQPLTFYHSKTYVTNVLAKVGVDVSKIESKPLQHDLFEYGLSFEINKKPLAVLGSIKKSVLKDFDVKQDVFAAEIDWNQVLKLIRNRKIVYQEISKYPEVRRDLSMVLNTEVTYEQLVKLAEKTERKLLKNINLFDVYQGDKIEKGKKSYALSFTLLDEEKTLTDNQIDKVMSNLMKVFETELGAKIRQ
jgi:phenylalanyl-tRNA synthetase beta chain